MFSIYTLVCAADTKVNNTVFVLHWLRLEIRLERERKKEGGSIRKEKRNGGRERKNGRERRNEPTYLQSMARKMTVNSIGINRRTRQEEKNREGNFESDLGAYKK